MPEVLQTLDFFPSRGLNRSISPHALAPDQARLLIHADMSYLENRLRRGPGICRTQVSGPGVDAPRETTVGSCAVWHTRSGKLMLVDWTSNGLVRLTPGDGSIPGGGPLPFCIEREDYDACCSDAGAGGASSGVQDDPACGGGFSQNFDDDCGVPPEGGECRGGFTYVWWPAIYTLVSAPPDCQGVLVKDILGNIINCGP